MTRRAAGSRCGRVARERRRGPATAARRPGDGRATTRSRPRWRGWRRRRRRGGPRRRRYRLGRQRAGIPGDPGRVVARRRSSTPRRSGTSDVITIAARRRVAERADSPSGTTNRAPGRHRQALQRLAAGRPCDRRRRLATATCAGSQPGSESAIDGRPLSRARACARSPSAAPGSTSPTDDAAVVAARAVRLPSKRLRVCATIGASLSDCTEST